MRTGGACACDAPARHSLQAYRPSCLALVPRLAELFPFTEFFADAPQPLFKGEKYEEDWEKAQVCLAGLGVEPPRCASTQQAGVQHKAAERAALFFAFKRRLAVLVCDRDSPVAAPLPPMPAPPAGLLPPPAHDVPGAGGDPAL